MSCGCRPVAGVRAEDRSEVTSVSRKRGQGRTPRRGTGDCKLRMLVKYAARHVKHIISNVCVGVS